jgi:hypothetical protein
MMAPEPILEVAPLEVHDDDDMDDQSSSKDDQKIVQGQISESDER